MRRSDIELLLVRCGVIEKIRTALVAEHGNLVVVNPIGTKGFNGSAIDEFYMLADSLIILRNSS